MGNKKEECIGIRSCHNKCYKFGEINITQNSSCNKTCVQAINREIQISHLCTNKIMYKMLLISLQMEVLIRCLYLDILVESFKMLGPK